MAEAGAGGVEALPVGRRVVMKGVALGALIFTIDGVDVAMTPREAHAAAVPLQVLSPEEQRTLEAVAEVLLPGARDAGVANFIDHQLAIPPGECLLAIRTSDTPPPYANTYHAALSAIDSAVRKSFGSGFAALTSEQQTAFVRAIAEGTPDHWTDAPPARAVYGRLRGDALDVVYGTVEGFETLGVPYMPHILPLKKW